MATRGRHRCGSAHLLRHRDGRYSMSIAVLIPGELMLLAVVTATGAGGRIAGTLVLAGSCRVALFLRSRSRLVHGWHGVGLFLRPAVPARGSRAHRCREFPDRGSEQVTDGTVRLQLLIDLSTHFDLDLDPGLRRDCASGGIVERRLRGRCPGPRTGRRAASTTSDRELDRFVDNLLRHEPQIDNPSHPAVIAIQTGKPVVLDHITADVLGAATDAEQRRAAGIVQGGSAGRRTDHGEREALGAMSLVRLGRPAQPFDSEEVSIAVDIAARAGEAFKRARTHQEVRNAFVNIQQALLPEQLPTVSGVSVCGVYRQPSGHGHRW